MTSLKLTYRRASRSNVDLAVTAPSGTTVAGLAAALAERDPAPGSVTGLMTLVRMQGGAAVTLDPDEQLEDAGIGSGAEIALRPAVTYSGVAPASVQAGVLTVVAGPDSGRRYPLHPGTNLVGRDPSCTVRLTDSMVSKLHAVIHIGATAEIRDSGSTNGVEFGGGQVSSAILRPGDQAKLGDTVVSVLITSQAVLPATEGLVPFNRSPRVDAVYRGEEFEAPTPPKRPAKKRFPFIPVLAPLLMGSAMYFITGSRFALVFILLSPLMAGASFTDDRLTRKRDFKAALADFRESLAALGRNLLAAAEEERGRRCVTHPATADLVSCAQEYGPLLWTRRPEHEVFLDIRLGLGKLASRNSVKLPSRGDAPQEVWEELEEIVASFKEIDDVPVIAQLPVCGAIGVAGPDEATRDAARSVIAQLVALHSPAEVVLTAVMSQESATAWHWLKWLPHTSPHPLSAHTPLRSQHLTTGGAASLALVSELDELIANRPSSFPAVVLLVSDDTDVDRSRLVDLAERGPAKGVYLVWVAAAVTRLPAVCRTFIEVSGRGPQAEVGYVRDGESVEPVRLEMLTSAEADSFARKLSPVADAGARATDDSDLPRVASFLKLARTAIDTDPRAVAEKWSEAQPGLRAMLGALGADETLHVDLCSHGPHALVGGTTGAGKSELLQSWLLGMAVAHDPRRVNFLLVDYKGGSAFGVVNQLPHSVGLVTDLNPHLVRRALTSLRAELTRREKVVERYHAKDLSDLERQKAPETPARLVIVVDEFAALKKEIPEFVDGMVDIAQRGRSLGLHLILATQRPAGIISEQLRANTNLRVALRMADAADSNDVLGTPLAAAFDIDIPGRAAVRTGPGRVTTFQATYAGGWTQPNAVGQDVIVRPMPFGVGQAWQARPESLTAEGDSDIVRIVGTIRAANDMLRLDPPLRPWLPSLPDSVTLQPGTGTGLVFGLLDLPAVQAQPAAIFDPDTSGNMMIFGASGSGKSTLLRTLALAGVRGDAGPCHVYGLDFGNRGLDLLEPLPQVGQIIRGDDTERLTRLLDRLQQTVQERAASFRAVQANTITEFWRRQASGYPRILLLIDGMDSLYQQYPPGLSGLFEKLAAVATLGRSAGVHVLMTASRPNSVPGSITATAQSRVVLRLASDADYAVMGIRATEAIPADAPPGRGLYDRNEVQVALADALQISSKTPPAPAVAVMPTRIRLSSLTAPSDLPLIGIDNETLAPVGFDPQGFFVITGMAGSGRSTTVESVCVALRRARPDLLISRPGREDLVKLTEDLRDATPRAVVIEAFPDLADLRELTAPLEALLKTCREHGHFVVAEGESNRMVKPDPLYQLVRSRRCGIALQQAPALQFATIFGFEQAKLPKLNTPPVGRGLLVNRGVPSIVHIALPT